ncbi:MAG: carboxypeptidase-like regulatory domain-containing protein [Planctomycetota bacterium]
MSNDSGPSRSQGLRLALAIMLVLIAGGALVHFWPSSPPPQKPVETPSLAEPDPAVAGAIPPEAGPTAPIPDERETVRSLPAVGARPSRHPSWRAINGVTRREDTGWPVNCEFTPEDAAGQALEIEQRAVLSGTFHVSVPDEAVTMRVSARNVLDLDDVVLDLPQGSGLTNVDVVLPLARGLLKGRVVDEIGSGVGGLRVRLVGRTAFRTTDSTGLFLLRPLRDGKYPVAVAGEAFAEAPPPAVTVTIKKGIQQDAVLFVIKSGAVIRGVVRSALTGAPLKGARLVLMRQGDSRNHRSALADGKGEFAFRRLLSPDLFVLTASSSDGAHGRVTLTIDDLDPGEERDLTLDLPAGAGSLTGQLTDEEGSPVPFASVVAVLAGKTRIGARSDTRGLYAFRSLAPGVWRVGPEEAYCETNNWIAEEGTAVEIHPGQTSTLPLRLRKGRFLEGQVLTESKRPGLSVRMTMPSGEIQQEPVGPEGRFAFGGLLPGTYLLEVLDPTLSEGAVVGQQTVLVSASEAARVIIRAN